MDDILAARDLTIATLNRRRSECSSAAVIRAYDIWIDAIRAGRNDDSEMVSEMLAAVRKGREIEREMH